MRGLTPRKNFKYERDIDIQIRAHLGLQGAGGDSRNPGACRSRPPWTSSRSPRARPPLLISKTLKSAIANAENNNNLRAETLVVREAVVGEGPTLKRFQPKARGSAGPIRKRTSHIRIIVTDEIEIKTREPRKPAARKKAAGAPKAKTAGEARSRRNRNPESPRRAAPKPRPHQKPPRRIPGSGSQTLKREA